MLEKGREVYSDFTLSYFDKWLGTQQDIISADCIAPITNLQYEEKIEDAKRNIFLLKTKYLNIVMDDMEDIMTYRKGSSQYLDDSLKEGENILLYQ